MEKSQLYELTCLINPDLSETEALNFTQGLATKIAETGKIEKTENPKKIGLSYPIKNQRTAFLMSLVFEEDTPEKADGLKTQLEKEKTILRFLLVKTKPEVEKRPPAQIAKGKESKTVEEETKETAVEAIEIEGEKVAKISRKKAKPKETLPKTQEEKKVEMEKIEEDLEKILDESQ